MRSWIPFEEGEYITERSYLVAGDALGLALKELIAEIKYDTNGEKFIRFRALVKPAGMVELHEDYDTFDLLIDFGAGFQFRLNDPIIQSGKVFAADVTATVQIEPRSPWQEVDREAFDQLVAGLQMIEMPAHPS